MDNARAREEDRRIPPHQFSEIDYASVCAALLAGLLTLIIAVIRVLLAGLRGRGRPGLRDALSITAGALSVGFGGVALGAYASWDGSTRPVSIWASAPRVALAALLIVVCMLTLRQSGPDGGNGPDR